MAPTTVKLSFNMYKKFQISLSEFQRYIQIRQLLIKPNWKKSEKEIVLQLQNVDKEN